MLKSSAADRLLAHAEAGDGRAMFDLAELHRNAATNDAVLDSWPEAHRWYRRAINAGVASAAYELGVCLLEARGVPMDVDLGSRGSSARLSFLHVTGRIMSADGRLPGSAIVTSAA